MNPHERKIIHMALQNDRRITTLSEGEEPYRKVVIELKNNLCLRPSNLFYWVSLLENNYGKETYSF